MEKQESTDIKVKESSFNTQIVQCWLIKYKNKNISEEVRLTDGKKLSDNANPEALIATLKFSRSIADVSVKAKEKKKCPKCGNSGKMVCYTCGVPLLDDDVLPQIHLPFQLYVYLLTYTDWNIQQRLGKQVQPGLYLC